MKLVSLRCAMLAVIAVVSIRGYGDGKVDYDKMELLVTNRLVYMRQSVMVHNYLCYVKQETRATDADVADCLARYINCRASAESGTKDYSGCRTAIWLFAEISRDDQMEALANVVETHDNQQACNALSYYYRRMRGKGGLEFVEKLLSKETLGTNVYREVSTVLILDAKGVLGEDVSHKTKLTALSRRQLADRKHCRIFDEVLSTLDAEYAESEQRKQIIEDAISNRFQVKARQQKYFLSAKRMMENRKGGRK